MLGIVGRYMNSLMVWLTLKCLFILHSLRGVEHCNPVLCVARFQAWIHA
jgi:hypothetical protein